MFLHRMSALLSSRNWTISWCPCFTARWSGVLPSWPTEPGRQVYQRTSYHYSLPAPEGAPLVCLPPLLRPAATSWPDSGSPEPHLVLRVDEVSLVEAVLRQLHLPKPRRLVEGGSQGGRGLVLAACDDYLWRQTGAGRPVNAVRSVLSPAGEADLVARQAGPACAEDHVVLLGHSCRATGYGMGKAQVGHALASQAGVS